ncbi:hypothetical protein TNCV_2934471 [Trichonephila clavipes]|nr:hypothetical protein TNCV_2934471 [Trichonephila clavipes]
MATGSSLTQNYSRSQSEIQGDLHKSTAISEVTTSPIVGATSEYMYPAPGRMGFREENDCDAERDRRERRDSGFTGKKPRFSVNVEANRLRDN